MRRSLGLMAAMLLSVGTPAGAQQLLNLSGTMRGNQSTIVCAIGDMTCFNANGGTTQLLGYEKNFQQTLFVMNLVQGDNPFNFGAPTGIGTYSGIINNDNGLLTGRGLSFSFYDIGVPAGIVGSRTIFASAGSFTVSAVAPVPEPATWGMMLLGFLAIGCLVRRGATAASDSVRRTRSKQAA